MLIQNFLEVLLESLMFDRVAIDFRKLREDKKSLI